MANWRVLGIGQLGRRIAFAFVAVAVGAILLNVAIAEVSIGPEISAVVVRQERSLTQAMALNAGDAYESNGWHGAHLDPVFDLAEEGGAAVRLRDAGGRIVSQSPRFPRFPAASQRASPVIFKGREVGTVTVRFGSRGLGAVARTFVAERLRASLIAAGAAALLAFVVSVAVALRITRPLDRMLETARAREAGDRSARVDPVGGIGVVRELIEAYNRSTDATDRQDEVRRNLVANVAHELRTPIAVLQAGHEAMLDGVTEATPANLGSLRDEVLRLARMVADLQALASAEAAALRLTLLPCDLSEVAAGTAASLSDLYDRKGVSLASRLAAVVIDGDERRVREIITNLLTNAVKFTPQGGRVELRCGPAGDGEAFLAVTDTGIGISAGDLPRVTERFFRGQRPAEPAGGSGIGLAIVSELVRAHRGELAIASEPGHGTAVTVLFPRSAGHGVRSDGQAG